MWWGWCVWECVWGGQQGLHLSEIQLHLNKYIMLGAVGAVLHAPEHIVPPSRLQHILALRHTTLLPSVIAQS